jgi:hypothetical protein
MADLFWDQPTDPSDPSDENAEGEPKPRRRRRDAGARDAAGRGRVGAVSGEGGAEKDTPDTDARLREALSRVVYGDTDEWERALRDAGFSDAQARHLIFERLRPRDEGRVRAGNG